MHEVWLTINFSPIGADSHLHPHCDWSVSIVQTLLSVNIDASHLIAPSPSIIPKTLGITNTPSTLLHVVLTPCHAPRSPPNSQTGPRPKASSQLLRTDHQAGSRLCNQRTRRAHHRRRLVQPHQQTTSLRAGSHAHTHDERLGRGQRHIQRGRG